MARYRQAADESRVAKKTPADRSPKRVPGKGERFRPSNPALEDSYDRMWRNQSTDSNN